MASDFSDILMRCSIYIIYTVSNSRFCSASLSSAVPSSFIVLVPIVSRETPAPFFLGHRKWRLLDLSLDLLVGRRV